MMVTSLLFILKLPSVKMKLKRKVKKIKLKWKRLRYLIASSLQSFHFGLLYVPAIIIFMKEVLGLNLWFIYLLYALGTASAFLFSLFKIKVKITYFPLLLSFFTFLYSLPLFQKKFNNFIYFLFIMDSNFSSLLSIYKHAKRVIHKRCKQKVAWKVLGYLFFLHLNFYMAWNLSRRLYSFAFLLSPYNFFFLYFILNIFLS